ncbi:MAG: hydrogenase maturation nickel metallochaperone HypA [Bacteroidota bacterium]
MHEFSLIANLMKKIDEVAAAQHAKRIAGVKVRLGAMSHISASHFREHFEQAALGTLAEGARLDIVTSTDYTEPEAQSILLESVEIDPG